MTQRTALMFVHAYYKDDTRVRREAEALAQAGWSVDVICLNKGDEPRFEEVEGVSVERSPITRSKVKSTGNLAREYNRFLFSVMRMRFGSMIKKKYDVIFVHNMPNFLIFATLPAKLRRTPVILDMHDSVMDVYGDIFRQGTGLKAKLIEKTLIWEEKLSAGLASAMITVNRPIRDDFQRRLKNRDYFLLHNAPDMQSLPVTRPSPKPFDPNRATRLLHHGNILARSGIDRIIPAMAQLNKDAEAFHFELHGRGDFYAAVEQSAQDNGQTPFCSFYGPFTHKSIVPHLETADAGLVLAHRNRLFDYALPNKFLEYVACKVPIIAQRLHTLEEYFPADCVSYVDTEEELIVALEQLRADPIEAQARADLAFERLQSISFETERPKFLEFVDQVSNKTWGR